MVTDSSIHVNCKSSCQLPIQMIFVVGNSRSGTTLMSQILGNSPNVFTFEELHFFDCLFTNQTKLSIAQAKEIIVKLFAIQASNFITPDRLCNYSQEAEVLIEQLQSQFLEFPEIFKRFLEFNTIKSGKLISCEQTPQNVFYMDDLLRLYPECRIINMVRDPRDVILSQKYKWKIRFLGASKIPYSEVFRSWFNYHPVVTSMLWNSAIQAANQFKDHPRVKTVYFENLVQDPQKAINSVCEFVEIAFNPDMVNVSQREGGISSHKRVSDSSHGIDPNVVNKWKQGGLSASEIYLCQAITRRNMDEHNYPEVSIGIFSKLLSGLLMGSLPFKFSLAFLLNTHRLGNLVVAGKKRINMLKLNSDIN